MNASFGRWLTVSAGVAALFSAALALPASAGPKTDESTLSEVVSYLEEQRRSLGIPGMAVAIVRGEDVLLEAGLGEAEPGRPAAADQPFLINSMSKSITALALVQLADSERLGLDDPVVSVVPELSPGADGITLRDLLYHSAGIPQYEDAVSVSEDHDTLEATVLRLEPLFGQSDGFAYTNGAYDTLALVVERVSGLPFDEYVTANVFEPLGMDSSMVGDDGRDLPGAVDGYFKWVLLGYRPLEEFRPGTEVGSGKMWSSAEDMARYLMVHLNSGAVGGTRVLSVEGLEMLHEGPVIDEAVGLEQGTGLRYGGGLFIQPGSGEVRLDASFPGPTLYHGGSSDTFRSTMWIHPGTGIGFVLLTNGTDDGTAVAQMASEAQRIMAGLNPVDVVDTAPTLARVGKWIAFGIVAAQLVAAVAIVLWWRSRRSGGWILLGVATLVDVAALGFLLWAPKAVSGLPLGFLMSRQPDIALLASSSMAFLAWGAVRTAVVIRRRAAELP